MKKIIILFIGFLVIHCNTYSDNLNQEKLQPRIIYDNYFGINIADPYRFMENDEDTLVLRWYKNQNLYTENILNKIANRDLIKNKLKEFESSTDENISTIKTTKNDLFFYLKSSNLDKSKSLFFRKGINGKEILLLNPKNINKNELKDHIINYIKPSPNGNKIAVSLTKDDQEISKIIIIDVVSKTELPEIIKNCWPSALGGISWLPDESGFIYVHIPDIDRNSKSFILNTSSVLYVLGQNPKKLNIIFSKTKNPNISINNDEFPIAHVEGSEYIFAGVYNVSDFVDYYYASISDLNNKNILWKRLYKSTDKIKEFFVKNDSVYLLTAKNASNFKLLKDRIHTININNSKIIVPEDELRVITDFAVTEDGLFVVKNKNGIESSLYKYDFHGNNNKKINAPPSGYINLISNGYRSNNLWIDVEGWITNKTRYKFNALSEKLVEESLISKNNSFELKDVIVKEVEVKAHDGMTIPLSIIHKKNIDLDSENRLMITGYGAYGISESPKVNDYIKFWVSEGGVYAIAHVRGGGEKGYAWHKGGYKATKPNTWEDFISCTEYLLNHKYTSPDKVFAWSGSAGGILIGRAITERPDLFKAVNIKAGMLNALRTEFGPAGSNNIAEFGSVKDSLEFKYLFQMDAYHHIDKGRKYPSMLITTGLNDPRGSVWESGKFVSRLLESSDNPILLSVDFKGGHGFNVSENVRKEKLVDFLSFALWQTGHPDFQPE